MVFCRSTQRHHIGLFLLFCHLPTHLKESTGGSTKVIPHRTGPGIGVYYLATRDRANHHWLGLLSMWRGFAGEDTSLWHDNETSIDLLGFDQLVDMIAYLVQRDELLPLTIGIFGDWGSGKSSVMRMAHKHFEEDEQYVCVHFSPWQHESYDDVKVALMTAVMTTLREHRSLFTKVSETASTQAQRQLTKLFKRINWFRVISFSAKGLGSLAMHAHGIPPQALAVSGLNDLGQMMQPEQASKLAGEVKAVGENLLNENSADVPGGGSESLEQSIDEFRQDFAALLDYLDVKALVVFIDDLDRCLPPHIIDTLEAMRLFLAVPKTAFILGADERIIRHAIASRYPELSGQAIDIGRDYLEKIVQFPLRLPALNAAETETYLNLLGCQLYLDEPLFRQLVSIASENRRKAALATAMNYGIAAPYLTAIPAELETYMLLVGRIAPILCRGLAGNPRQTKRFINTLLLRQRLPSVRNVTLDPQVLAKLMILEYFHEAYYRQLFLWQAEGNGVAAQLAQLEPAALASAVGKGSDIDQRWLEDAAVRAWLQLEPALSGQNLEPYFYFARDHISMSGSPTRRLSQQLQELLGKLRANSDIERQRGMEEAMLFSADDLRPVYEEMLSQFQRDPRALNNKLGSQLVELASQKPELVSLLAQTLLRPPPGSILPALALTLKTQFTVQGRLPREVEDVLQQWSSQTTAPQLASAAKRALTSPGVH